MIPGPLPLDCTASLHTGSRSPKVSLTPFRVDLTYQPTSVCPPHQGHRTILASSAGPSRGTAPQKTKERPKHGTRSVFLSSLLFSSSTPMYYTTITEDCTLYDLDKLAPGCLRHPPPPWYCLLSHRVLIQHHSHCSWIFIIFFFLNACFAVINLDVILCQMLESALNAAPPEREA